LNGDPGAPGHPGRAGKNGLPGTSYNAVVSYQPVPSGGVPAGHGHAGGASY